QAQPLQASHPRLSPRKVTLTLEVQIKVKEAEGYLRTSPFSEHSPHRVSWEELLRGGEHCPKALDIPPCLDSELTEFPLRMRDWLKNVLVTLYERDEDNNLLTEKQKLRVKKIHENEKRLEAGDHPVELLARDFEKNYNMYIFPVHWQFGQLDQHPFDGYLSHTELAPLRAPLIPMEHCTTRFFETCDLDNDKYIALDEWAGCFGIKEKDIDKDLVI
ncbi:Hypothetical predicted protein, partial [Marmota monax]